MQYLSYEISSSSRPPRNGAEHHLSHSSRPTIPVHVPTIKNTSNSWEMGAHGAQIPQNCDSERKHNSGSFPFSLSPDADCGIPQFFYYRHQYKKTCFPLSRIWSPGISLAHNSYCICTCPVVTTISTKIENIGILLMTPNFFPEVRNWFNLQWLLCV